MKKPRADSTLKTLPPERQAAIAEYARDHSLTETRQWLKDDGLITSEAALSDWLSWYRLQAQLHRNESTVETLLTRMKSEGNFTPEQIALAGQSFFTELALQQQDPDAWVLVQRLNLQREQLGLDREKLEMLKLKAAQADEAKEVLGSKLSPEEQRQRLKEILK